MCGPPRRLVDHGHAVLTAPLTQVAVAPYPPYLAPQSSDLSPPWPCARHHAVMTVVVLLVVVLLLVLLVRYRVTMPSSKLCPSPVVRASKIPVKTQAAKSPVASRPAEVANRNSEPVRRPKKSPEKDKNSDIIILRINEAEEKPTYVKGSREKLCRINALNRECSLAKTKVIQSTKVSCNEVSVSKQLNGGCVVNGKNGSLREVMAVTRLLLLRRKCASKPQRGVSDTLPPLPLPSSLVLDKPSEGVCTVGLTTVSLLIDSFSVNTGRKVADRRFRTECQVSYHF